MLPLCCNLYSNVILFLFSLIISFACNSTINNCSRISIFYTSPLAVNNFETMYIKWYAYNLDAVATTRCLLLLECAMLNCVLKFPLSEIPKCNAQLLLSMLYKHLEDIPHPEDSQNMVRIIKNSNDRCIICYIKRSVCYH